MFPDILGYPMTPQRWIFVAICTLIALTFVVVCFRKMFASRAVKWDRSGLQKTHKDEVAKIEREKSAEIDRLTAANTAEINRLKADHAKEIERIGKRNGSLFAKTPLKNADEICEQAVLIQGTLQGFHHSMYASVPWYARLVDMHNLERRTAGQPEIDNIIQMAGQIMYHFENFEREQVAIRDSLGRLTGDYNWLQDRLRQSVALNREDTETMARITGTSTALHRQISDLLLQFQPSVEGQRFADYNNGVREGARAVTDGIRAAATNQNSRQPNQTPRTPRPPQTPPNPADAARQQTQGGN